MHAAEHSYRCTRIDCQDVVNRKAEREIDTIRDCFRRAYARRRIDIDDFGKTLGTQQVLGGI
jgi:hypothetical protein